MLIDTHAHLDYPEFDNDRDDVIARAAKRGVDQIVAMGTRVDTSSGALRVAEKYPDVFAAPGIHPLEAGDVPEDYIERLREIAQSPRVVALGEIGLDYFQIDAGQAAAIKAQQQRVFREQMQLAAEMGLNVVLHQRDAWEDTLAILAPYTGRVRGVFHCFKGTPEQVSHLVELGHLVSFTGMVTFPEMPQIATTASVIPAGTFMLETDAPFHTPPPDRKERCEPGQVRTIAETIAQLRGITCDQLAKETTATARRFFRFPK